MNAKQLKNKTVFSNYYRCNDLFIKLNRFDLFNNTKDMQMFCSKWAYNKYGICDITEEMVNEFLSILDNVKKRRCNGKKWETLKAIVFKRDNYTCVYCGLINCKLELDHIYPFSLGGSNDIENLNTSCVTCNRKKSNKIIKI